MENHLPGVASRRGAGSALLRTHTNIVALGEEFVGGEAEKVGEWEEEEELVQQISSGSAGRGRAMAAAAFGLRVERCLSVPPGRQAHGEARSPRRHLSIKRSVNKCGLSGIVKVFTNRELHPKIKRCSNLVVKTYKKFEVEIYVLAKDEADICGKIEFPPDVKIVMPGDNVTSIFELMLHVPLEPGLRFVLREGGRTVGSGVIAEVMS
uniref:Elongation factor Tu, mitochondrial n=1 Tax=Aegilops tauschii TaxID=37682 RepID=M8CEF8_AEGTA